MGAHLKQQPLLLLMASALALAMYVPAIYALQMRDHYIARAFFYAGSLLLIVLWMIGIAMSTRPHGQNALRQLLALGVGFFVLPFLAAVPFAETVRSGDFFDAYVEMVSALTTTGGTLYVRSDLPQALHLWRGLMGWMGGAMMWIAALAIFAPLGLGGFELEGARQNGTETSGLGKESAPNIRIWRATRVLMPIYSGLTLVLCLGLILTGQDAFSALMASMAVLSTSGIHGAGPALDGFAAEALCFIFFIFALSRVSYMGVGRKGFAVNLSQDRELRLAALITICVPMLLFLRHWIGAYDDQTAVTLGALMRVLWGAGFTVLSFLSTTGFESEYWGFAQIWSGMKTPSLILMGLALLGGGVGTTAGGVKLLRIFVITRSSRRELQRLAYPSSVARRDEALSVGYMAWVFFMLFAVSLCSAMVGFSILHIPFEAAFLLAISAITTTGPLLQSAFAQGVDLAQMSPQVKALYAVVMVLGRLESLALVALLTRDLWGRGSIR